MAPFYGKKGFIYVLCILYVISWSICFSLSRSIKKSVYWRTGKRSTLIPFLLTEKCGRTYDLIFFLRIFSYLEIRKQRTVVTLLIGELVDSSCPFKLISTCTGCFLIFFYLNCSLRCHLNAGKEESLTPHVKISSAILWVKWTQTDHGVYSDLVNKMFCK